MKQIMIMWNLPSSDSSGSKTGGGQMTISGSGNRLEEPFISAKRPFVSDFGLVWGRGVGFLSKKSEH